VLPPTIEEFPPGEIPGPDDNFTALADASGRGSGGGRRADAPSATCQIRPVREALAHNSELLKAYDLDLGRLLAENQDSTLNFGSEFRPVEEMRKILGNTQTSSSSSGVLEGWITCSPSFPRDNDEVEAMIKGKPQVSPRGRRGSRAASEDVLHGFSLPV
jgi:hypothetical protein